MLPLLGNSYSFFRQYDSILLSIGGIDSIRTGLWLFIVVIVVNGPGIYYCWYLLIVVRDYYWPVVCALVGIIHGSSFVLLAAFLHSVACSWWPQFIIIMAACLQHMPSPSTFFLIDWWSIYYTQQQLPFLVWWNGENLIDGWWGGRDELLNPLLSWWMTSCWWWHSNLDLLMIILPIVNCCVQLPHYYYYLPSIQLYCILKKGPARFRLLTPGEWRTFIVIVQTYCITPEDNLG